MDIMNIVTSMDITMATTVVTSAGATFLSGLVLTLRL
jgi:hypothetical protein